MGNLCTPSRTRKVRGSSALLNLFAEHSHCGKSLLCSGRGKLSGELRGVGDTPFPSRKLLFNTSASQEPHLDLHDQPGNCRFPEPHEMSPKRGKSFCKNTISPKSTAVDEVLHRSMFHSRAQRAIRRKKSHDSGGREVLGRCRQDFCHAR